MVYIGADHSMCIVVVRLLQGITSTASSLHNYLLSRSMTIFSYVRIFLHKHYNIKFASIFLSELIFAGSPFQVASTKL
jgi:hypothetical protein